MTEGAPILYIGKLAYVKTLRERIKTRLSETGLNQVELAKAADVSEPSVTDWCNGNTRALKLRSALGAARALRTTVEWLATGRDSICDENGNILPRPTPIPTPAHLAESDASRQADLELIALARHVQAIIRHAASLTGTQPWDGVERRKRRRRNITKI